ncbi:hypothetical protein [Roseibium marinum]|uniref:Uncharacterized protein n=1 Tax=Roseibium marinum TaxID=281252 RepID=A0A2S3UNJ9_9HYPH|nr:hypothetical protein [Roseibium marinum]POF29276.1 hypothetical protein CLV41_10946 [Roseibium marinum]
MAGKADILKHMRSGHIGVFQSASRLYNVAILVRRTNTASLQHIGESHAVPKRLDCKAKTADFDVVPRGSRVPAARRGCLAGLVVDPGLVGEGAYSGGKYVKALEAWRLFSNLLRPEMASCEKQKQFTYVPGGGQYFVERDPEDPYYGCVKFTSSSLITAGKCIHGDFDLYGIVDMDAPDRIVRVREERLGETHARSPKFLDVQNFVNSRIGAAMVLHGSQETYACGHEDDDLDVFFPDGRVEYAGPTAAKIAAFYQREFPGRTLFRKDDPAQKIIGRYVSPATG